jgi:HD-GYP domain-containing protein (c-di-GMP phosphodiesterase class II)
MTAPSRIRLAELVAMISLGTDLGMGQSMEHVMRQSVIALRLAERLGLDEDARAVVYYVGLLGWVGCHVDAYEQAKWFGDEQALKADFRRVDMAGAPVRAAFVARHAGRGGLGGGQDVASVMIENHCVATRDLAAALGLGADVREALYLTFARWDGKGVPARAAEEIPLPARLVTLADVVEIYHRSEGVDAAVEVARERRGTQFDPGLVDMVGADVFEGLDAATTWQAVIEAEPGLGVWLSDAEVEAALGAIADFSDLKSPWTIGHSRGVAELAFNAAPSSIDATLVRRAGLVHDLGRLGVSNAIWDKPGPLTAAELERVRLHPYLTERMLASSAALAPLAAIAVQHHERLDGSGYPRGLTGDAITPAGRVLAAADAYHAMTEPRPHRPALSPEAAASELRAGVRASLFDADAADAVLRAAGHAVRRRREFPAGLTGREVEVLRLLVRGMSNREIADELVISHKTAGSHVEHIYAKLGVSNRARASLFAMKHGLVAAE